MIKNFSVLLMMSLLVLGISFVFAADQTVQVTIGGDVVVAISPNPLDFGNVLPNSVDNAATNGPIMFDATGSNVDVTVQVSSVSGFPFADGLMFDGEEPVGKNWLLECTIQNNICTYDSASTVPTLNVPAGSAQGQNQGTITYTVTGPQP